jgi:hypothetical protein
VSAMATELADQKNLADLYKSDFYAWARHQAEALRDFQATRPTLPLDLEHLIEEVDALAVANLAVESQLRRIMVHYLKLEHSPAAAPRRKWAVSIIDAQAQIDDRQTSSMRRDVQPRLERLDPRALRIAKGELFDQDEREAAVSLPKTCPYTLDQFLDETWRPASCHGHVDEHF